jgi:uncharacterized protein (DUF2249 family)/hemerythrin-like domain-containing protein
MSVTRELDVRTVPPPRRHPEIFGAFDALAVGEAFVLVNDHDPKPLLYQFQAERPGRFDWSHLEAGPERFRIEIRRRLADGPRDVSEHLEGDHRRLDAMIPEVHSLLMAGSRTEAGARFAEFSCGLGRHIEAEEKVLFPAFEQLTGMVDGPTVVMRTEHDLLRRLLVGIPAALAAGEATGACALIQELVDILDVHNMKEERIVYPMTDQAAGDDRTRDDLVKRLQAL